MLICLSTRRFVVARPGEPRDLWPVDGGWEKLRELKPGDEVFTRAGRNRACGRCLSLVGVLLVNLQGQRHRYTHDLFPDLSSHFYISWQMQVREVFDLSISVHLVPVRFGRVHGVDRWL